jgi:hypothetical protein
VNYWANVNIYESLGVTAGSTALTVAGLIIGGMTIGVGSIIVGAVGFGFSVYIGSVGLSESNAMYDASCLLFDGKGYSVTQVCTLWGVIVKGYTASEW